ncbi:MAG: hypothetical protein QXI39_03965 [Candidatus Bathyarchaeia archaeon]
MGSSVGIGWHGLSVRCPYCGSEAVKNDRPAEAPMLNVASA